MKKIFVSILVVLIVLFFIFETDKDYLGDNYYYLPAYLATDIGYPGGAIIYKSQQKNLFSDVIIEGEVIEVNSNENFIIAIQELDNLIYENGLLQFFIIAKKLDLIYGPYDKENYMLKRTELSIPKNLMLEQNNIAR